MLPLGGALALALKKERGARLTGMAVALRQADPAPFDPPSLSISPPSAHLSLSLSLAPSPIAEMPVWRDSGLGVHDHVFLSLTWRGATNRRRLT